MCFTSNKSMHLERLINNKTFYNVSKRLDGQSEVNWTIIGLRNSINEKAEIFDPTSKKKKQLTVCVSFCLSGITEKVSY